MAELHGEFPKEYSVLIKPSDDPISFFSSEEGLLLLEHFCHPHCLIWYTEVMYQSMHPGARPKCPWHDTIDCVCRNGWYGAPRRGHTQERNTAIIFKRYYCNHDGPDKPKYFRGIDKRVTSKAPDYVRGIFEKLGFDFSHRSALSKSLLNNMQYDLVQGLSMSGF